MALEQALVSAAQHIFRTDRDNVTINAVRKHVAAEHGLADDYFKSDDWKDKSKQIITDEVNRLMEEDGSEGEAEPVKAAAKPKPKAPKAKPKAAPKPKAKPAKAEPAKAEPAKAKAKAAPRKRKLKAAISDSEDESAVSEPSEDSFDGDSDGGSASGSLSETKSDSDSDVDVDVDVDDSPKRKKARTDKAIPERPAKAKADVESKAAKDTKETKEKTESDSPLSDLDSEKPPDSEKLPATDAAADDSDSMSSVLDDPPPKKRGKKGSGQAKAGRERDKGAKEKTKEKGKDASPDEAEIKKLQGQLVKCGVRKIWAFELRAYGDDSKAKIRHLKGALHDIGMDGRFSEARARAIKERRELEADLEAVQEMDKNWGVGGRSSRAATRQSRGKRGDGGSGGDDDGKDGGDNANADANADDDDEGSFAVLKKRAARFNDLSFLDSESSD